MRRTTTGIISSVLCILTMGLGTSPAHAGPTYVLLTTIPVPPSAQNSIAGGKFQTYDIAFFDGTTQLMYLADRSNASVDIFSAQTNSFVGRIGGTLSSGAPMFSGQQASNDTSGPDGVLVARFSLGGNPQNPQVWAGNGDSTLKGFDLTSPNLLCLTPLCSPPPRSALAQLSGTPIVTGPTSANRVDEMAFDPKDHLLLAVNNAASPSPFATLVDTSNNSIVKKIVFDGTNNTPNATGGAEQPVWDKNTQRFYISIPQINGGGPGGVSVIRIDGTVEKTFDFGDPTSPVFLGLGAKCSPAGLAVGNGSKLVVGCGDPSQTIILDPLANNGQGAIKTIPQVSGEDMVWFDPTTNRFFVAARFNPGGPVLGIIDGLTDTFLQNVPTTPNDHSVAVDPVSGEVFVPFGGIALNFVCPDGCIAIFVIPEPTSLLLLGVGLIGFGGLGWRRRRRQ